MEATAHRHRHCSAVDGLAGSLVRWVRGSHPIGPVLPPLAGPSEHSFLRCGVRSGCRRCRENGGQDRSFCRNTWCTCHSENGTPLASTGDLDIDRDLVCKRSWATHHVSLTMATKKENERGVDGGKYHLCRQAVVVP